MGFSWAGNGELEGKDTTDFMLIVCLLILVLFLHIYPHCMSYRSELSVSISKNLSSACEINISFSPSVQPDALPYNRDRINYAWRTSLTFFSSLIVITRHSHAPRKCIRTAAWGRGGPLRNVGPTVMGMSLLFCLGTSTNKSIRQAPAGCSLHHQASRAYSTPRYTSYPSGYAMCTSACRDENKLPLYVDATRTAALSWCSRVIKCYSQTTWPSLASHTTPDSWNDRHAKMYICMHRSMPQNKQPEISSSLSTRPATSKISGGSKRK